MARNDRQQKVREGRLDSSSQIGSSLVEKIIVSDPPQDLPGGEDDVGDVEQTDATADVSSRKNKNQVEMALLHLDFLEQELRALVADGSPVAGLLRRTAAGMKQQFDGDVKGWPPLKTIRTLLAVLQPVSQSSS
jgi:hypothetical protein